MRSSHLLSLLVLLLTVACRPSASSTAVEPTTVEAAPTETPIVDPNVELCPPGGSPEFDYGFAALKARLGDTMGTPLSCERPGPLGDTVQQTTTGYARYNKATNTPSFTRASEHWALTTRGLVHWSGPAFDPPVDAERLDPVEQTNASGVPVAASDALAHLHFTYRADHIRTYTSTTRVTVDSPLLAGKAPPPMEIDMRFTYRSLEVHPDESATMLASIDDVSIWSGGKVPTHVPELEHLAVRSLVMPDGSTVADTARVERDGLPVADADVNQLYESMITFAYPRSPLHTGDTFGRDFPLYLGPSLPRADIHSVYRFVGLGSIDAISVARIEQKDTVSIGDWPAQNGVSLTNGQLAAHGWNYVGLEDGWPVSGESDATFTFVATKSTAGPRSATGANASGPRATFTVHVATSYRHQ